ncbi:ketimine reductase mu-crystallin-like [Watersipora subatra]|uniref:ketimine reductase mu-crystallin-like n=1 Tax=Watersipora subatra TaxID=2589382 RepID=UPI00355AD5AB
MRTGAASAVATKHIVEDCSKPIKLALLGAGVQALSHYQALKVVTNISKVSVWSRTMERAVKCAEEIDGVACLTVKEAVDDADIIVTVTSSPTPILEKTWVKPGAHINAVEACRSNWQEIDPELMQCSAVYVDSRAAALKESGDVIMSNAEVYAEIGEVINKSKPVKRDKFTVFKSLGLGIEDAVAAKLVYDTHMANENATGEHKS